MEQVIDKIYALLRNRETEDAVIGMFIASLAVLVFVCIAAGLMFGAAAVMLVIAGYIAMVIRIVFGLNDRDRNN